ARAGTTREEVLASLRSVGPELTGATQAHAGAEAGRDGHARAERVRFLDLPVIDVSSSAVRRRAADGRPIEDWVGPDVAGYVREQGLYRAPPGGASCCARRRSSVRSRAMPPTRRPQTWWSSTSAARWTTPTTS